MKTVKSTVGFLFGSRRGSAENEKEEGGSNKEKLLKPKVNYQRRFSMPYAQAVPQVTIVEEAPAEYPIYQWPSFRNKNKRKSTRRHSVAVDAGEERNSCRYSHLCARLDEDDERRPSLASLQAEDRERRPSIIMYQSEDSQHPDVMELQRLVERINFTEQDQGGQEVNRGRQVTNKLQFRVEVTTHNS